MEARGTYMREYAGWVRENQARVLAGIGSPKILIGGMNLSDGPNFHTLPLIQLGASVVFLSIEAHQLWRPDRLYCAPDESLAEIIERLPSKWRPDFFYDSQAEHGHYFPVGLGGVPFPTIVSFNHAHLGHVLLHMEGMFDHVLAPSKRMAQWGDPSIPWGGSWGTMDDRIRSFGVLYEGGEKHWDVACTLGPGMLGPESDRDKSVAEMKAIKARRPDWQIAIPEKLSVESYYKLLRDSKVVVNVCSWGAPMTYRPLEALAQQCSLVSVDETSYGSEASLEEFFPTGGHGWFVKALPETLEKSIELALELREPPYRPNDRRIAANLNYSYFEQFKRLFALAGSVKPKKRLSTTDWSRRAYAVNYLAGYDQYAAVHEWALTQEDRSSRNDYRDRSWDVCLWRPRQEDRARWMTRLALRKEDPMSIYREIVRETVSVPSGSSQPSPAP